jgi:cardiolipin synthase (CMP-forming)
MPAWLTPPNALTAARMAATPVAGWLLANNRYREALPLIMVLGLTDALDGFLARRFRWQSAVGAYLDPIADKFLLAVVYLSFWISGALPGWVVLLILGRDAGILLSAALLYALTTLRSFPPSVWGKISTFFQLMLATATVLEGYAPGWLPMWCRTFLLWGTVAATLWSGVHYLFTEINRLLGSRAGNSLD